MRCYEPSLHKQLLKKYEIFVHIFIQEILNKCFQTLDKRQSRTEKGNKHCQLMAAPDYDVEAVCRPQCLEKKPSRAQNFVEFWRKRRESKNGEVTGFEG